MSSKKATYFSIAKFTLLMNHDSLRQYLYDHIPLTKAMQVDITAVSDSSLTLTAPLTPNINHRETVFGGSASALCILSAWSYIHCRLKNYPQFSPRIVIQENSMKYTKPVLDQFEAICTLQEAKHWSRLITTLERKGIGRIRLSSDLISANESVGSFEGAFVISDMNRHSKD